MKAVIVAPAGTTLNDDERALFARHQPLGFILFGRNIDTPAQTRSLVESLRACVSHPRAPVLIDQEGGRVARLRPPHWRAVPAAGVFAQLVAKDPDAAFEAARINARLIAADLAALGISHDCAPVLDVPQPGADQVIGDRALGGDPETVTFLGEAMCEGLMAGGILPIIKHAPGHGRAGQDSHKELPVVNARYSELEAVDFRPFSALSGMPWVMTAHILYTAIDADRPATISPTVIEQVIRGELDMDGVLVSDDLGMEALSGSVAERCMAVLEAGCDLALHCSGDLAELRDVLQCCPEISPRTRDRLVVAEEMREIADTIDPVALSHELDRLIA